ncbi:MAG: hypothetical protein HWN81_15895 [Candidatus Lokiarchaeota archaeon]|nr:hypothetical protein [Candidatus Lokiarchaeota archaeon]
MPRKIDKEKYISILERLQKGEKQSSIVNNEKCSYGTISSAKQWDKEGRPTTIITPIKSVANTSRIIFSIPTFWLDLLNENIEQGIWMDYSDAIVDIIRTYFRMRMDSYKPPQGDVPTFADKGENFRKVRRNMLKELKNNKK